MKYLFCIAILFFIFSGSRVSASSSVGSIDGSNKFAWGENAGWINFAPSSGGLTITDSLVTGFAWSNAAGWINFNPSSSGQGVTNTCDGVLGGYAWSSALGFINMAGVSIDSLGIFRGMGGVSNAPSGRVAFECDHCRVQTDWRHCADRNSSASSSPSGGGSSGAPTQAAAAISSVSSADTNGGACIDIVPDSRVDILDFNAVLVNWGSTAVNNPADTNKDGIVDVLDFNSVLVCWTKT